MSDDFSIGGSMNFDRTIGSYRAIVRFKRWVAEEFWDGEWWHGEVYSDNMAFDCSVGDDVKFPKDEISMSVSFWGDCAHSFPLEVVERLKELAKATKCYSRFDCSTIDEGGDRWEQVFAPNDEEFRLGKLAVAETRVQGIIDDLDADGLDVLIRILSERKLVKVILEV